MRVRASTKRVPRLVVVHFVLVGSLSWPISVHAQITIGPHLQDVRQDGVTVVWAQGRYGPGQLTVDGTTHSVVGRGLLREKRISGLQPNTRYTYNVRVGRSEVSGAFKTAPSDPSTPFRFVVFGDNRTLHKAHQAVVDAIVEDGPFDFLINTGDMVEFGELEEEWQNFFQIEAPLISKTPWYPVIGNHEVKGRDLSPHYLQYLAPPTETSSNEAYYSFTYANSAFLVLDGYTNIVGRQPNWWPDFSRRQQQWLRDTLSLYRNDSNIAHIFVLTHRPPYTSYSRRTGCHALRLLQPLLLQNGVRAIIAGHAHHLERGSSPEGLNYWVMGGGGAPLYKNIAQDNPGFQAARAEPWLDDAHTVHFAAKSRGFMVVTVNGPDVTAEIKGRSRTVLDVLRWTSHRGSKGSVGEGPDQPQAPGAIPSPAAPSAPPESLDSDETPPRSSPAGPGAKARPTVEPERSDPEADLLRVATTAPVLDLDERLGSSWWRWVVVLGPMGQALYSLASLISDRRPSRAPYNPTPRSRP